MVTDGNYSYRGEHGLIHRTVESLGGTLETNNTLCQLYFDIKKLSIFKNEELREITCL